MKMNERLEQRTREVKETKTFVVALPLTGIDISRYFSMDKTGITKAFSERQAVSYFIARQKRQTGLIMGELDRSFGGAEKYAIEVPEFETSDGSELTQNQEAILKEMYVAEFLSSLRGGNPRAYLGQAERVLQDLR